MWNALLISNNLEVWISLWGMFIVLMYMLYHGKLPSTGQLQDLTTILNSRGGNILILAAASLFFFIRAEHMYLAVVEMIKAGTITADNGIALNGLTFDTGAFGGAFGALLKTMSPDAPSPAPSNSASTTSVSTVVKSPVAPVIAATPTKPSTEDEHSSQPIVTQGIAV